MIKRDQRLQQLIVIWRYIKTGKCLENVVEQCQSTTETNGFGVLSVVITVDLMQLSELNSDVATYIIRQPLEGTMLFREVVHQILITKGMLPDNSDTSRLAVSLRIEAATLPDMRWAHGKQARYSGLMKLTGIILGVTTTATYTKSTKYMCPNEDCEGHQTNQYVRVHIPGASEKETIGRKFLCCVCGAGLTENKSQRRLSDKLLAEVLAVHDFEDWMDVHTTTGHRHQTVHVLVRDDLCQSVELGKQYDIILTQKVDSQTEEMTSLFEANNLMMVKGPTKGYHMPSNLQLLVSRWKETPVLPYFMALKLSDEVCPGNCFFKLKLMLLVSLVLTPEDPPVHVVAVCTESHLVQRVMDLAGRLAPRALTHSSLHVLGVKVTTSLHSWAPYFLRAGSLVLASGGVCKVGDVRTMKKTYKQELQTALAENRVQVALETRYTGGLPQVLSLPLHCHVWGLVSTHSATTTTTGGESSGFSYGTVATASDVTPALLDAFSLVCHCEVSFHSSTDVTQDLTSHILASNMATTCEQQSSRNQALIDAGLKMSSATARPNDSFTFEDLKKYVQVARAQTCVMTVEAEWLLTSYLIAARHARAHTAMATSQGAPVPLNAWSTLQALSYGVCRLSLRSAVVESDALVAVMLHEETLSARHGMSALNVFPEPHLPAHSAETYITTKLVPELRKFHSRLLSFCGSYRERASSEE